VAGKAKVYQITKNKAARLGLEKRILLFMYRLDRERGRDGDVSDKNGDLREALFRCSSALIHFADVIFANVIYWDELKEDHSRDHPRSGFEPLRQKVLALAHPTTARRTAFNRLLAKLVEKRLIYAFRLRFRALAPFGSRAVPLLEIWNPVNRDRPKDIVAASLGENGFKEAALLNQQHAQLCHWQLHTAIVEDRELAKKLTGIG
jgi:hypothetical protein